MFGMRDLIPWARGRELVPGRRETEHPLVTFQRDVDRLFEDFWRSIDLPMFGRSERWGMFAPRTDVSEDEKEIRVTVELPGLDERDVEVLMTDNMLVIKGEKKAEREEKGRDLRYAERCYGAFQRSIPIDAEIMTDKVEARFSKGLLTVVLPKTEEAQKAFKRIPIAVSAEGKETTAKAA
jgi:HSP20 family protein